MQIKISTPSKKFQYFPALALFVAFCSIYPPPSHPLAVTSGNVKCAKRPRRENGPLGHCHVYTSFTFYYVLLYFYITLTRFYITFFMFCYTFFNIYQLNLTVTNYQNYYPSYQKSYPTVTTVIIPTLLSDYHFPRKISTYINFAKCKIRTYEKF